MAENDNYLYSAFISYRHTDPDQNIAKRVQHSIETFTIPVVYRKQGGGKHFRKVFRDSDELSLDKDLASGIDYALTNSEFLIVILSPQYKESQWCLHEIDEFLKTHDRKNILCVLAEGEPGDVLPQSLTHIPSEENPDEIIVKEPLCADYRLDRTTAERLELPRLLCSMLSCDYDNLIKRQEVYRRKKYLRIGTGIFVALVAVMLLQFINLINLSNAYDDTIYNRFQTLAGQSLYHLSNFDREEALELSLLALPGDDMPVTAEAIHSLSKATYIYQPDALALIRNRSMQNEIIMRQVSEDQSLIVTMDSSGWILVQSSNGERLSYWQIDGIDDHYLGFFMKDNDTVFAWRGSNFYSYDYKNYKRNWCVGIPGGDENSGIISVDRIDDSTCSILTSGGIVIMDLNTGKAISQHDADSIAAKYKEDGAKGMRGSALPRIQLYRQLIDNGEIFVSGSLKPSSASSGREALCLAAWDPAGNTLQVRTYDLPAHCLQLQPFGSDHLAAVSSEKAFDAAAINYIANDLNETPFSYMKILCFDRESLKFRWEYDTEVAQTLALPNIGSFDPGKDNTSPYLTVGFDVDNYMFDVKSGELVFSMTLPDNILLTQTITDDEENCISYLCSNHKHYLVYPTEKTIYQTEGITTFPETVQAVNIVGEKVVAFSGQHIYWFGAMPVTNSLGEIRLVSDEEDLEYFDAGNNLLGCYSNKALFLIDLKTGKTVQEVSLSDVTGPDQIVDWKYSGSLPDDSGFIMLCKNELSGQVKLYTYDLQNSEFALYDTILEKASFSRDAKWIDSFAFHDRILYTVDPEKPNTLLYHDIVNKESERISVTGIPSSMIIAEAYDDFVNRYELNEATLVISPDGRKAFTTLCAPASRIGKFAVIDLGTGECSIPEIGDAHPGRSHFGVFSEDGSDLAFSTDYSVYIVSNDYSKPVIISTSGLNVRSMTWYDGDLWVEFSNNIVRRYAKDGSQIAAIELDNRKIPFNGQNPQWVESTFPDQIGIMLIDEGNMNLLSADTKAGTPILHIPGFVGWNNEGDTFVVRSMRAARNNTEDIPCSHLFYIYPHYTVEELIEIGRKQHDQMTD